MSSDNQPNVRTGSVSGALPAVEKYHRDFYYLGKSVLRLGICIFVITLVAKLAFGGVSPILITILCVVSVLFIIIGILRIAFSYSALRSVQNSGASANSVGISTISNFRAFIQNNSNRRYSSESPTEATAENIHCGNRTFGSPTLVAPPSYEPPPSYEQIQKDSKVFESLQIKA